MGVTHDPHDPKKLKCRKLPETHRKRVFGCLGVGGGLGVAHHRPRTIAWQPPVDSDHAECEGVSINYVTTPFLWKSAQTAEGPGDNYLYAWEQRGRNEWSNISRMRTAMSFKFFRDMRGHDPVLKTNFCEQRFFGGVARGR